MKLPWVSLGCLLGAMWSGPLAADQVVLSEIMSQPRGEKPQFIEVYNNTSNPFEIAQWRLSGGVRFDFADFSPTNPPASYLQPFERIVLSAAEPESTRAAYGLAEKVRIFGPWQGKLKKSGEKLALKDKNGITVCLVNYLLDHTWPLGAEGFGHSLELANPNAMVDEGRNWRVSLRPDGTPGAAPQLNHVSPVSSLEIEANLGQVLLDYDAVWRYQDSGQNLGTAWRNVGFNDSAWAEGPGLIGYDSKPLPGPGLKTRANMGSQITYYHRIHFLFEGRPPPGSRLHLDQIIDDGVVYYLNGEEIGRTRIPEGTVQSQTLASSTVGTAVEEASAIVLDPAKLRLGTNVLAAEVHQCKSTSSDVVFGVRLRLTPPPKPGLVINELWPEEKQGFVELCNTAKEPLNLKGCSLSDATTRRRQPTFTTDRWVPPNGLVTIPLAECGLARASALTLYLIAPDGSNILNAVTANFAQDARPLGRWPDGGEQWFRLPTPSPGRPNSNQDTSQVLLLNEVHVSNGTVDWIEVFNPLDRPSPLEGVFVVSHQRQYR